MLIKINKEGDKVINLSFGSDEPPKKKEKLSAQRAIDAAAEAAAIAAGAGAGSFMELYGGSSSENINLKINSTKDYYDQNYIDELKLAIKNYINKINDLNNLIQPQKDAAVTAAEIEINVNNLNINTDLVTENLEKMRKLNIDYEIAKAELERAKNLKRLSADKARMAALEAEKISEATKQIDLKGGYVDSEDIQINNLKNNIRIIQNKIHNLNNIIDNEKNIAHNAASNDDKKNLVINTNLAENNLEKMKKLEIELRDLENKLKDAKKKPEGPDDGYAISGPAAFPGSSDPSNKFKEGDYVVVTGSRKPEKQKFINKTGKIRIVLEKGVGKNTSKMTRYDVDFGALGSANFKESRLKLGRKEDYKSVSLFNGGDHYREKYLKYKAKYLALKKINI